MRSQPRKLAYQTLLDYALKLLTGRALSIGELREKLRRRAAEPGDVDTVLAKLKEAGYLSDERFAESFAAARLENQGFGKMRVLRDLRARRVAPGLAEQTVKQVFDGSDETALIEAFLARKYRGKDLGVLLKDERQLMSAFRKLRMAGFGAGNAIGVLKRYAAQAEQIEELEEPEPPGGGSE